MQSLGAASSYNTNPRHPEWVLAGEYLRINAHPESTPLRSRTVVVDGWRSLSPHSNNHSGRMWHS